MGEQLSEDVSRLQVFNGFKSHFGQGRSNTEATMIEIIRKAHPSHHITCAAALKCDLLGYANAGHATATLDTDEHVDATRNYKSPGPRLLGRPGKLKNHNRFARWSYAWEGNTYIVYEIEYQEPFRPVMKVYFILSPRTSLSPTTTHPTTDALLLAVGTWTTVLHDEIYVFDDGTWTKDRDLYKSVQSSTWQDVILNPTMKASLMADVEGFFHNRTLYKSLSVPWKRGVILHGVPGNGKTISIKALINSLNNLPEPVPSLYVKSFTACQGEKYSICEIFRQARLMAPCLLIFEDLDSLVTNKTRSYFLNEVDGLESNDGILMIGSTNHLDALDPAISKRPSRFDRKYHFKIPDVEERELYCAFWRKKIEESCGMVEFPEELCQVIAKLSEGFSFAYLKELFVISLLTMARGGLVEEEEDAKITHSEPVIVEHETRPAAATADTASSPSNEIDSLKEKEGKKKKESKPKRTIPDIPIPESVTNNAFLKVLRQQLQILLDEMESTAEEDWPSGRANEGGSGMGDYARQLRMLQARNAGESDDEGV